MPCQSLTRHRLHALDIYALWFAAVFHSCFRFAGNPTLAETSCNRCIFNPVGLFSELSSYLRLLSGDFQNDTRTLLLVFINSVLPCTPAGVASKSSLISCLFGQSQKEKPSSIFCAFRVPGPPDPSS